MRAFHVLTVALIAASASSAGRLRAHESDPAAEVKAALSQILGGQAAATTSLVKGDPPTVLSPAASRDELHDLIADITKKNEQISALKGSMVPSTSSAKDGASAARAADDAAAAKFVAEKSDQAGLNPKIDYLSLPGVVTVKDDQKPIPTAMEALLGVAGASPAISVAHGGEVVVAPACGGSLPGATPCDKQPVVTVQGQTMQWQANGPNAGEPVTSQPTIESKVHLVDHLTDLPSMPRPHDAPEPANYGPNATFHVFEKAAKDAKCDCNCGAGSSGAGSGAGNWMVRHELDMSLSNLSVEDVYVARKDVGMIGHTIAEFKEAEERLRAKREKLEAALKKMQEAPVPKSGPVSADKEQFDAVFAGNAVPDAEKKKLAETARAKKAEKDPEALKRAAEADKAVAAAQENAQVAAAKEIERRVVAEGSKKEPAAKAPPAQAPPAAPAASAATGGAEPAPKANDKDAAKQAEELLAKAKEEQQAAKEQIKKSEAETAAAVKSITDSTLKQIKEIVDEKK